MKPITRITIDGRPATGLFMSRLISCEVTDREGTKSDTVQIELEDSPPAAIPRKGAIIKVWMGYLRGGIAYMGAFTADEVEANCLPYSLRITGKAADLRAEMKQNREVHWDDTSVADIVSDVAKRHGLIPRVAGAVGSHVYKWFGQQDESDIHVLERLAKRHNALFSVKDGHLIFAELGSGLSALGAALTPVIVRPGDIVEGSCRVRFADRTAYKDVIGYYHDRDRGERVEIKVASSPDGSATYRIGEPFADEEEARRAVEAKAKELLRAGTSTSVQIVGRPSARGGAPLIYAGVRAGADGVPFILDTARHRSTKESYTTNLDAKIKV